MAKLKKGNSLLIYKTEKGYYFNRETGKRMKGAAYQLQFMEGRRIKRQAVEKGLKLLEDAKSKKDIEKAQRITEQFSESLRIKEKELKEFRQSRELEEFVPYWELANNNKGFKNGRVKIITPSGGVISSKEDNLNALDAFQDLTNLLNKAIEQNKKAGGDSVLVAAKKKTYFNPETGEEETTIDFSQLQEFTAKDIKTNGTPEEEEMQPASDSIYEALLAGWLDRQASK